MLSRTADSLFWLARFVERAENLARIIDVAQRMSTLPSAYAGSSNEWESALATAACEQTFFATYEEATRANVIGFIVDAEDNPSSIRRCIEQARTNARAVRTAITGEMWEVINDAWLKLQSTKLKHQDPNQLANFLAFIKEVSLRFDGAAYRTMLRDDSYWFERLGLFIERADNTARLLDVKYHVLLPEKESVGGGLDYFQWSSILRAVSAQTSFHYHYRESVKPWLVADFLILRPEQPRSLIASYENINRNLDGLAQLYGRQGPAQRLARQTYTSLENQNMEALFQVGLHEFVTDFIDETNRLGEAITHQYLT